MAAPVAAATLAATFNLVPWFLAPLPQVPEEFNKGMSVGQAELEKKKEELAAAPSEDAPAADKPASPPASPPPPAA